MIDPVAGIMLLGLCWLAAWALGDDEPPAPRKTKTRETHQEYVMQNLTNAPVVFKPVELAESAETAEIEPKIETIDTSHLWLNQSFSDNDEYQNSLYRMAVLQEPERANQFATAWRAGWRWVPGQIGKNGFPKPGQLPRPV